MRFLLADCFSEEFLMKSFLFGLGAALLVAVAGNAWTQDFEAIEARLATIVPDMDRVAISETPVPGIVQVRIGGDIVYMSDDGRFLLQGRMVDMETQIDLTDAAMSGLRKEQIAELESKDFVTFGNDQADFEILVFTDPDCGYCRRLHEQIDEYEAAGIKVHYLAFPRAGVGSQTYDKMVSVWCADDRQSAMNIAKAGRTPPQATCDNPVTDQYQLGQAVGVTGTPSIVTFNGDIIPGYVPPAQLRERLERLNANGN
jgi:thiol:disulfide interchange protein DsbC